MGVIAKGIPRGYQVYSPPCPWDTHYQFSIKTLLSKKILGYLSNTIIQRVPRTGTSVYRQSPPPPDLLPVVTCVSTVPAIGLSVMVPSVMRPHVDTAHTAHMALFAQGMYNLAQATQL